MTLLSLAKIQNQLKKTAGENNHNSHDYPANTTSLMRMKKTLTLLLVSSMVLVSTSCSTTPTVAAATVAPKQDSLAKLNKARLALALYGYSCRTKVNGRYLQQGESYDAYTTLLKGNDYMLVATGDTNVKDIDVVLHDENHNVLARDSSNDATPMVQVSPKWTGRFHAKIKMHRGNGRSNLMVCYK